MRRPIDPAEDVQAGMAPGAESQGMTPAQDDAIPPTGGMEDVDGATPASPEEQAQYDRFAGRAMELIYSDKMFDKIVDMLEGGGDPVKGLAMTAEMVVARIGAAAEQSGEKLTPDVVFHAGGEILEDLAEVSKKAKIKDYSADPDSLESAWFQALDLFAKRLAGSGELDKGSATADLEKLKQMDQNGTLEKIMRDLAANDEAGQAGGEEGPAPKGKSESKGFGIAMKDAA